MPKFFVKARISMVQEFEVEARDPFDAAYRVENNDEGVLLIDTYNENVEVDYGATYKAQCHEYLLERQEACKEFLAGLSEHPHAASVARRIITGL